MHKNQNWGEQEAMMATAVVNIANTLPSVAQQMKQYVRTVQNGGGVINDGALQEMLDALSKMINANLHNVSQSRVNITLIPLSSNISESKRDNKKIRLSESQLHNLIKESVKRVLSGLSDDTLKRAEAKARAGFDDAISNSPYWDDWDGEYPEHDKFQAKRERQMKKFRDELRKRGKWDEGNGWQIFDN